jgi:hypothetical protein
LRSPIENEVSIDAKQHSSKWERLLFKELILPFVRPYRIRKNNGLGSRRRHHLFDIADEAGVFAVQELRHRGTEIGPASATLRGCSNRNTTIATGRAMTVTM